MKRDFQQVVIDCWHEKRNRLSRSDVCLCMQAEPEAIQVLRNCLAEVAADSASPKRTMTLRTSRTDGIQRIQWLLEPDTQEPLLELVLRERTLVIRFSPGEVEEMEAHFLAWQNGGEDFALCSTVKKPSQDLWFWRDMLP